MVQSNGEQSRPPNGVALHSPLQHSNWDSQGTPMGLHVHSPTVPVGSMRQLPLQQSRSPKHGPFAPGLGGNPGGKQTQFPRTQRPWQQFASVWQLPPVGNPPGEQVQMLLH